ncbi:MAG: SdpI family protein [Actinomycetota bacterium]
MDGALLSIVASLVVAGVAWYVAWAGRRRALPKNALLGIRTRSTTRTDAGWYAAHQAAAPYNVLAGIWFLVGGLLAGLVGDRGGERATILASAWAIALVQVAAAVVVAGRAARAVDGE